MAYKGYYRLINTDKYRGNPTNIVYRSLWEKHFMKYCDTNKNVLAWSSEEITIPYRSPLDRRLHRYYPDFWLKAIDQDGNVIELLIEIKPKKQTKSPELNSNKLKSKKHILEARTWVINQAKWEAAEAFCNKRKWKFKILTEEHLFV